MRFKTLLALVVLIVANAAPAYADDHNEGVRLLTQRSPVVVSGESLWLTFNWTSRDQDISQFSATATANKNVTVEYPENTPGFTGLMDGHILAEGEVDFTALKLTIPYATRGTVQVTFVVTYVDEEGREQSEKYRSRIRVKRYTGDVEVTQLDAAASVAAGSGAWVDVDFTTRAPRADNVSTTVADASGLAIEYPGGASATSLHFDDRLSRNETDTARFYVDAEGAEPGEYVLLIETTYEIDGKKKVLPGSVEVTVTG